MAECAIYDASTDLERQDLINKRTRKVIAGVPITIRFKMRNPLLTEIICKVHLVCGYKNEDDTYDYSRENFSFEN